MVIDAFVNNFFLLLKRPPSFQGEDEDKGKEFILLEEKPKYTVNEFNRLIVEKEKRTNKELFKKRFKFQSLIDMQRELYKKGTSKNKDLVNVIKNGLKDLKEEIEEMSKDENENEKPDETANLAEKILEFNNQSQQGQGLKILTSDQMLSRLPITLAELKA